MSTVPLVLDAAGLDALSAARPSDMFRALLVEAHRREAEVIAPTVVCAEVARGQGRTRALESALSRRGARGKPAQTVRLCDTDFLLARQVGAILEATGAGSEDIVDAHVVAVCVPTGAGLVVTSDPDDVTRLAAAVPAVRVRTLAL